MLPLSPHLKIILESLMLGLIILYLVACLGKTWHPTCSWFCVIGAALAIDIFIYHAIRPPVVWGILNTPSLCWVGYLIYAKILRKSWPKLAQRLAALCTMLFR